MTGFGGRDPAYIDHMLGAIARIRSYVGRRRRAGFLRAPLLQDAVLRNIEIIGEAAGRVSPEFAARHPEIPWRDIVGMRNRLIHGYLTVNLDIVWRVVATDLRVLQPKLQTLAAQVSATAPPPPAPPRRPRASGGRTRGRRRS